jgi:quercetin dioxygenase-like cupin family protein
MRTRIFLFLIATVVVSTELAYSETVEEAESENKKDILAGTVQGLKIDNILTSQLELVEGTEVVVSHVEIPANTTLPKHWHPGEEFVYVLEGSEVLWQKDKPDVRLKKGDVFKVPLRQIHTATTGEEGVTVLVFRVHEKGQPVRVNVE